jgi:hypothetical protein
MERNLFIIATREGGYRNIVDLSGSVGDDTYIVATGIRTRSDAHLFAAAPEMLAALEAQSLVDEHILDCEDCCDGAMPELCPEGFPLADDARTLRQQAIAKARGEAI